jgi:hypothetical protein
VRFEAGAELARQRANGSCEVCGRARGVMTHHRQPRGMGGVSRAGTQVNRVSCLLRVCIRCNDWIEVQHRADARELGLLVPRPLDPAAVKVWLVTAYGEGWFLLSEDGCYERQDGPEPAVLPPR